MADPAATLRALAGACEECDRFDRVIRGRSGCDSAQRDALMCALPRGGWPETAATLRTMADTIDRLTRERDEARALLAAPKPKRDPLTDPRPGDVVRFRVTGHPDHRFTVYEVFSRTSYKVVAGATGTDETEDLTLAGWSDWSDFEVQVIHTADEVTP